MNDTMNEKNPPDRSDALRALRAARLRDELEKLQEYWSHQAKERGIFTEEDLERYLRS